MICVIDLFDTPILCSKRARANKEVHRSLLGIPISGQLLEATGGEFYGLIVFAGLAYAVALVSLVTVRIMGAGWRMSEKF